MIIIKNWTIEHIENLFDSETDSGIKWIQKDWIFSIRNFRQGIYRHKSFTNKLLIFKCISTIYSKIYAHRALDFDLKG